MGAGNATGFYRKPCCLGRHFAGRKATWVPTQEFTAALLVRDFCQAQVCLWQTVALRSPSASGTASQGFQKVQFSCSCLLRKQEPASNTLGSKRRYSCCQGYLQSLCASTLVAGACCWTRWGLDVLKLALHMLQLQVEWLLSSCSAKVAECAAKKPGRNRDSQRSFPLRNQHRLSWSQYSVL